MSGSKVSQALAAVQSCVASLCKELGRAEPTLVAVSKTKPAEMLMEAYECGQRHFGENYVQELVEKAPQLPADIKWHFIGALQSNKVKLLKDMPNLYMVESVHTVKLANMLEKNMPPERAEKLKVMVQVNTSGEESKSGCEPSECVSIVSHVLNNCPKLDFAGLMTIGKLGDPTPKCFEILCNCRDEVLEALPELKEKEFGMSMGMSGDYELALRHGSTSIRVGSIIFGSRDYGNKAVAASKTIDDAQVAENNIDPKSLTSDEAQPNQPEITTAAPAAASSASSGLEKSNTSVKEQ